MKLVFNFFFFGMVFYLIHFFFPDVFQTLVSWADQVVVWVQDLFAYAVDQISQMKKG